MTRIEIVSALLQITRDFMMGAKTWEETAARLVELAAIEVADIALDKAEDAKIGDKAS